MANTGLPFDGSVDLRVLAADRYGDEAPTTLKAIFERCDSESGFCRRLDKDLGGGGRRNWEAAGQRWSGIN